MRKTMKVLMLLTFSYFFINSSFAAVEDTQVIDELNDKNTTSLKFDFKLKKFESCEDMSNVLTEYMKKYYNSRPNYYYGRGEIMLDDMAVTEGASMDKAETSEAPAIEVMGGDSDYSKTNVQVAGVDESEIIKTDGKYI
ncbi:hypothetical protein EOM39_06630, partial [Candidatus Gracilibacteria bacterium]|nr:hypothetical protein [Candidatus Gracilibacteria bacterium]